MTTDSLRYLANLFLPYVQDKRHSVEMVPRESPRPDAALPRVRVLLLKDTAVLRDRTVSGAVVDKRLYQDFLNTVWIFPHEPSHIILVLSHYYLINPSWLISSNALSLTVCRRRYMPLKIRLCIARRPFPFAPPLIRQNAQSSCVYPNAGVRLKFSIIMRKLRCENFECVTS